MTAFLRVSRGCPVCRPMGATGWDCLQLQNSAKGRRCKDFLQTQTVTNKWKKSAVTLVGHRDARHSGLQLEQLGGDGEGRRGGGVIGLVRIGLAVGDEILDRLDRVVGGA